MVIMRRQSQQQMWDKSMLLSQALFWHRPFPRWVVIHAFVICGKIVGIKMRKKILMSNDIVSIVLIDYVTHVTAGSLAVHIYNLYQQKTRSLDVVWFRIWTHRIRITSLYFAKHLPYAQAAFLALIVWKITSFLAKEYAFRFTVGWAKLMWVYDKVHSNLVYRTSVLHRIDTVD